MSGVKGQQKKCQEPCPPPCNPCPPPCVPCPTVCQDPCDPCPKPIPQCQDRCKKTPHQQQNQGHSHY